MATKKQKDILSILEHTYLGMETALDYNNEFELLVAVILSAQCTDERVNIITKRLFPKYPTAQAWVEKLDVPKIEKLIHDCGLFRAKAKNLYATCQLLVEKYNGAVPQDFDQLVELPGVGRKTANVMLGQFFNIPAIAVDTHVFRTSRRIGLAKSDNVLDVEQELMKVIPKNKWSAAHHWLIWHGRKICKARKPLCDQCPLNQLCTSADKTI
mgnify:CR=1 FL=1